MSWGVAAPTERPALLRLVPRKPGRARTGRRRKPRRGETLWRRPRAGPAAVPEGETRQPQVSDPLALLPVSAWLWLRLSELGLAVTSLGTDRTVLMTPRTSAPV